MRKFLVSALVVVGVVAVVAAASGWFSVAPASTSPAAAVTMAEFTRVKTGDSLEDVRRVIGAAGVEASRSEGAGVVTVVYGWSNADGSNMTAMFQGDKLVSKAQAGLR